MGMENGTTSSDLSVSDKAPSRTAIQGTTTNGDAVSFDLKLQITESFPSKNVMGHNQNHHRHDHRRSLVSTAAVCGDDGSDPTPNNSGANEAFFGNGGMRCGSTTDSPNIYRDDFVASPVTAAAAVKTNGGAEVLVRSLQPFDISPTTVFKSPVAGMAATAGFPFTAAQWKELQRQAMIYKYMTTCVPVPPDLLFPFTRNVPADCQMSGGGGGGIYNLRLSNNRDPEPGRCKRTDGKKWRCSRDVAPHQKYCERHMHRGRPRSRKPVELHAPLENNNNKKTRLGSGPIRTTSPVAPPPPKVQTEVSLTPNFGTSIQPIGNPLFPGPNSDHNISASSCKEPNRAFGWTVDREMAAMTRDDRQWQQHLMNSNLGVPTEGSIYGSNGPIFQQDYEGQSLNLYSYAEFASVGDPQHIGECNLYMNPDMVPSEKQREVETPRCFIDAWSNDNLNHQNHNKSSISSSQGNLSPSSLTLTMAMAAGNVIDEEMGHIQLGDGVSDCHDQKTGNSNLTNRAPWGPFASGGPLAEVLQPSAADMVGSNPDSPFNSNGDSTSPAATTVSSPTGVLQKAFFSHSDNSVCNSPTPAAQASAAPDMIGFKWLT